MDSIYSNAFQIAQSYFDFQIEFAKIEPLFDGEGNITGSERNSLQRVNLPRCIAKELAEKMNEAIKNYEERFGEIQVPKQEVENQ